MKRAPQSSLLGAQVHLSAQDGPERVGVGTSLLDEEKSFSWRDGEAELH